MDPSYPLLAAMLASMVLFQLNQRLASPTLGILNRWLRWLIFSFGAAYVCRDLGLIDRSFGVLAAVFFLCWFLLETLYNWLAIHALSVSPLPLFPRYELNASGEEWPTQARFLKLREWLRGSGFKRVQPIRADLGNGLALRASIYEDPDARVRLQIMFLPQPSQNVTACFVFSSQLADGHRIVTDNLFIPFAGFYPENWLVERCPWRRSPGRLLARHASRIESSTAAVEAWTSDPLEDLNAQQGELDRLNTEMGFLHPQGQRQDFGKITHQGRYRVWKEIWMLDYFGRPTKYV